jgi:histone deacetylase 4/5
MFIVSSVVFMKLPHWPCIKRTAHTAVCSAMEATQKEKDETETVTAMASLSMQQQSNSLQYVEHCHLNVTTFFIVLSVP